MDQSLLARHRKYLPKWMSLFYEEPIELVRGEGVYVWDDDGNRYLDFFGGILVTISGHGVPEVTGAIKDQADLILHSSTLYLIRPMVDLAEELCRLAPIDNPKVFFVNSGTEAIEAALLLATLYRKSNKIVNLRHAYHGRSFTALGVTGQPSYVSTTYSPLNVTSAASGYCYRCPYDLAYPSCKVACAHDLQHVIDATPAGPVAAVLAEPIQGVAGFVTPPPEYFQIAKEIADRHGCLFIADEVQTGFGRTGEAFFGIEAYGVRPDLIVCAKGLGNGLAIGAVIGRAEVMDASPVSSISTFGGNPLASRGALANLRYIQEHQLQANALRVGGCLIGRLREIQSRYPAVGDVRGKGLMIGVELVGEGKQPAPQLAAALMERAKGRGLLVGRGGTYGNVIRIAPPLVVSEAQAEEGARIFEAALAEIVPAGAATTPS